VAKSPQKVFKNSKINIKIKVIIYLEVIEMWRKNFNFTNNFLKLNQKIAIPSIKKILKKLIKKFITNYFKFSNFSFSDFSYFSSSPRFISQTQK
jgi:hypothetical protein